MADIFLSYAREDRERIKTLVAWLEEQGWSVWWDRRIPPGKTFDQVIEEAINAAGCIIVVWSKDSVNSDWVRAEAEEGANRKRLVPVLIDNARPPLGFRRVQAANLADWDGNPQHAELESLFHAVRDLVNSGPATPRVIPPVRASPGPQTKLFRDSITRELRVGLLVLAAIGLLVVIIVIGSWRSPKSDNTNVNANLNTNQHLVVVNNNQASPPPSPTASQTGPEIIFDKQVEIFNNRNIYGVENNPPRPTQFTIDKPYYVNYVTNYHWNNGAGKDPTGMHLHLRDEQGRQLGNCALSATASAAGGPPNVNWICAPNVLLPPGSYTVIDPDPRTWSYNKESGYAGMTVISGYATRSP